MISMCLAFDLHKYKNNFYILPNKGYKYFSI
jgi:hypothetical protein